MNTINNNNVIAGLTRNDIIRKRLRNKCGMTVAQSEPRFVTRFSGLPRLNLANFINLIIIIGLTISTTAGFAQKTVSKPCLDSIVTDYTNYDEVGYFVDDYGYSSYSYNEYGRHTQSFYQMPMRKENNIGYQYLHVLRDRKDNIIDSNQKYLTEIITYSSRGLDSRWIYDEYDDKGNVLADISMYWGSADPPDAPYRHYDWGIGGKGFYTYDEKGMLIEEISAVLTPAGWKSSIKRWEYTYDNMDNVICCIVLMPNLENKIAPWEKFEYMYDAKGNMIEKLRSIPVLSGVDSGSMRYSEKWEYTYDNMDNLVESIYSMYGATASSWKIFNRDEYMYDVKGNMVTRICHSLIFGDSYNIQKYEYSYDDMGNVTMLLRSAFKTETNQYHGWAKYECTYDSMSNITMCRDWSWNSSSNQWQENFEPSTFEYTYLPYSETDAILPYYDSTDYANSIQADIYLDIKLKGIVSEVKLSVYRNLSKSQRKEERTISYYWGVKDVGNDSVSIVEFPSNKIAKIQVYPNPTTGQLTIESVDMKIERVEILDILGKCVFTTPNPSKGGESSTSAQFPSRGGAGVVIDVSHLASGAYFVSVYSEGQKITRKFVKE